MFVNWNENRYRNNQHSGKRREIYNFYRILCIDHNVSLKPLTPLMHLTNPPERSIANQKYLQINRFVLITLYRARGKGIWVTKPTFYLFFVFNSVACGFSIKAIILNTLELQVLDEQKTLKNFSMIDIVIDDKI